MEAGHTIKREPVLLCMPTLHQLAYRTPSVMPPAWPPAPSPAWPSRLAPSLAAHLSPLHTPAPPPPTPTGSPLAMSRSQVRAKAALQRCVSSGPAVAAVA